MNNDKSIRNDAGLVIQSATDASLTEQYLKDLGHKAIVKREIIEPDDVIDQLTLVLQDVGRDIQTAGKDVPKGLTYKGSIACHIYTSELLKESAFYCQIAPLDGTAGALTEAAAIELKGRVTTYLGGRAAKKRSGW